MIQISKSNFLTWIQNQPNDKKFDFTNNFNVQDDHHCACPMVQYGKEQNWQFKHVGCACWYDADHTVIAQFVNFDFYDFHRKNINTYGELKAKILNHHPI